MYSITTDNPDSLSAEWEVSNHCNYQCSYCDPMLYGNTTGWVDPDVALKFWKSVHTEINSNDKMLTLTGGEPTLWPKLFYFLDNLESSYEIGIVSNGSRTLRWWHKLSEINKVKHLTISIHLEYASVEHIANVIDIMSKNSAVAVLIVINPSKVQESISFAEQLKEKNLTCKIILKTVTLRHKSNSAGDNSRYLYSDNIVEYINNWHYWKQNSNVKIKNIGHQLLIDGKQTSSGALLNLISNGKNSFTGWKCNIIKNRITVNTKGEVYGSKCQTGSEYPLGNIRDGKINKSLIPSIPAMCKDTWCQCAPDIRIPKEKV